MNFELLVKRIGVETLPGSPLERLQALHRAISETVPFENIAIMEGKKISLEPAAIFKKVVEERRGGYCFELNGLLAELLEYQGYKVERLIGRVWANGAPAPPLTHMTLRVSVGSERYLCDVGFGGGTVREPMPWEMGAVVDQSPDHFRMQETENGEIMVSRLAGSTWLNLYSLLPCPMRSQDYIPANHYTSTHPDSYFTQQPVAALTTRDGRVTLRGRLFRRIGINGETEREIATFNELIQVLSEEFGLVDLDAAALESRLSGLFV